MFSSIMKGPDFYRITSAPRSEAARTDLGCSLSSWDPSSCLWFLLWPWSSLIYTHCPVPITHPVLSFSTRPRAIVLEKNAYPALTIGWRKSMISVRISERSPRSRILLSILGRCLLLIRQPQWLFFISNYTKMQDEDCYPEVPCISLMVWQFLLGKREQQQTEHIRALPSMIDSCAFASQPCQVCLPL